MISNQSSVCNRFNMQFTQNTQNTQNTRKNQHPSSASGITTYTPRQQQIHTNIRLFATMNDVLYTPLDGRKCSSCGDRKK